MDEKGLGKRLQSARQSARLTQQQLCVAANISYSTLAKIERGAIRAPSIFTIQSIAAALGVSLDTLMGDRQTAVRGRTAPLSAARKRQSKSGVRFVYFDLNDCLIRPRDAGFARLAQDSGQPIDVVESVFWRYDAMVCRGEMSLDELNTVWAERLGIMVDWKQYYLGAADAMPGMAELVSWAAERYYIGILSNTMPGFIAALQIKGLLPRVQFDAIIDSSEVHAIKPEPRMYEIAAARAGMPVSEILLIDDSRPNLIAAENSGWHTIRFDSYDPAASIAAIRQALEID